MKGSVIDLQEYRKKKLLAHHVEQRSGLTRFLGGLILGALMVGIFLLGVSGQQYEEGSPQTNPGVEQFAAQPTQYNNTSLLFIGLALAGLGLWGSIKNKRMVATLPKKSIKRQRSKKRFHVTD